MAPIKLHLSKFVNKLLDKFRLCKNFNFENIPGDKNVILLFVKYTRFKFNKLSNKCFGILVTLLFEIHNSSKFINWSKQFLFNDVNDVCSIINDII